MIVTQYDGSRTVNVYASTNDESDEVSGVLLSDGRIQTEGETTEVATDDAFVTLKPAGMYYFGLNAPSLRAMARNRSPQMPSLCRSSPTLGPALMVSPVTTTTYLVLRYSGRTRRRQTEKPRSPMRLPTSLSQSTRWR